MISVQKFIFLGIFTLIFLLGSGISAFSQEGGEANAPDVEKTDELMDFMEEGMKEIDYYSIEELLDVEIEVASLFAEDELVAGSTVSSITPARWNKLGARRSIDALSNELNVMVYPYCTGAYMPAIRGFSNSQSINGVSFLLDGMPMNDPMGSLPFTSVPNWELGTLNKIEMIKGPGSAIYGSDAFNGVISMKTFESDKNCLSITASGGYPVYGDGSMNLSYGMIDNLIRIDAAAGISCQSDLDMEYEYDDHGETGTGKRQYQYDSESGVLKISIKPADKLKIRAAGYISRWDGNDFIGVALPMGNVRKYDQSSQKVVVTMGNGSAVYTAWSDISIELSGYYWQQDVDPFVVNSSSVGDYTEFINKGSRSGASVIIKQPDNAINLQWLAAYSFAHIAISEESAKLKDINGETFPGISLYSCEGFSRDINSVFTQLKWAAISDSLHLIAGGRIDDYSDFGSQITPRGGIIFLPASNSSLKALYGRAFKAPTATERVGTGMLIQGNKDLDPETIDTYELIYIYKEKEWKLSLNTYYSIWRDGIIVQPVPGGGQKYMNKGDSRAYGGEFSLFYSFNPFAVDMGAAYTKSTALDILNEATGEKEDRDYVTFPEYTIICGLHYFFKPLGMNFFLNNRIYLNMKEYPQELEAKTGEESDDLPPYYRMDLNISRSVLDRLDIYLDIRNVLNRENRVPSLTGAHEGYEEPGISVLLRASYRM